MKVSELLKIIQGLKDKWGDENVDTSDIRITEHDAGQFSLLSLPIEEVDWCESELLIFAEGEPYGA